MKIMKKMLAIAIEWSIVAGMTGVILSVDGFWPTLGLVWLMCVIASTVTVLRGLSSGKLRLVLPATPATPESSRDDNDDFLLFADHITE
jgi:hypothetical protein